MFQFNISFLFKAIAISALGCLPITLDRESGFVWTAFLLPISLSVLVATQIGKRGQHEFEFKRLSHTVIEVDVTNGRYDQWFARGRTIFAGAFASMAIGPPVLNIVDPEPIGMWLPLVVIFSIAAIMLISYSDRLRILTDERQLVTEHLMFGCICWWRRRWKVQEGDYLAVQISGHEKEPLTPEFRYFHALCVYRGDRPRIIAYVFTKERDISDMDRAANRIAELLGLPYEGYREMEPGSLYSAKLPNSE